MQKENATGASTTGAGSYDNTCCSASRATACRNSAFDILNTSHRHRRHCYYAYRKATRNNDTFETVFQCRTHRTPKSSHHCEEQAGCSQVEPAGNGLYADPTISDEAAGSATHANSAVGSQGATTTSAGRRV
jgi:hypothetical protein